MIHQGNILKEKVKELRPNLDLFASALGMTRQNLYNVYGRSQIDFITLEKACEFLKIDESLFDQKANKLKQDVNISDKINTSQNNMEAELRATIDILKQQNEFLQDLVKSSFQGVINGVQKISNEIADLKKHSSTENLEGEKELFKVAA